jgi:hypothetical protein
LFYGEKGDGNSRDKYNSRSPSGMTTRRARQQQRRQQIPFGDDNKKGKGNNNDDRQGQPQKQNAGVSPLRCSR